MHEVQMTSWASKMMENIALTGVPWARVAGVITNPQGLSEHYFCCCFCFVILLIFHLQSHWTFGKWATDRGVFIPHESTKKCGVPQFFFVCLFGCIILLSEKGSLGWWWDSHCWGSGQRRISSALRPGHWAKSWHRSPFRAAGFLSAKQKSWFCDPF